jgi:Flp pilus assembly pilin Flp
MIRRAGGSRPGESGATLVQYALAVALLALVVASAARHVGSSSKEGFEAAGAGVERSHGEGRGGSSGGGGSGGGGGGGGSSDPGGGTGSGGGAPATSTPVATTAPPPASSTTTAPAPTTTVPPDQAASAAFSSAYGTRVSSSRWRAHGELTLLAPDGSPVAGAEVEVVVRGWSSSGGSGSKRFEEVMTLVADADGNVSLATGQLSRSGSSRVSSITMSVRSVETPDGFEWDGATPEATVERR